jgi:ABC-type transport system substrate-binding protein
VLPEHFWAEAVANSANSEELYVASGEGAPGMWAYDFSEWEPGAFARNVSNENYPFAGSTTRLYADGTYEFNSPDAGIDVQYYGEGSGEVTHEYTEGPFAGEVTYSIYTSQDAAVLALTSGEVDYMLTSLGLQRGLQQLILAEPDLDLIVNPSNAYRYLAFNTRKAPMNDTAFRQAIACLIDKEFMANTVLGGAAIPVWSQVPEGNAFWHNPDAPRWCQGLTQEERLNTAIQLLEDAGYTWDTKPVWDPDNLDALPKGEGLRSPNGDLIPEMTLLAPGPGYDPLRATYALFIEDWANDLGVPVRAEPTGFNVIVDAVFTTDPQFDMYILGWTLTPFPDHVVEFFETAGDSVNGGNNTPGYSNPEFDALANQFSAATDLEEARVLIREMDAILAEDLPYVVLFTTPIIEPYRTTLQFPFTSTLDGIQNLVGLPSYVQTSQ